MGTVSLVKINVVFDVVMHSVCSGNKVVGSEIHAPGSWKLNILYKCYIKFIVVNLVHTLFCIQCGQLYSIYRII